MKKIALVLAAAAGFYAATAAPSSAQTVGSGIQREAMDANARMMGGDRMMMRRKMMMRHDMMMRRKMMMRKRMMMR